MTFNTIAQIKKIFEAITHIRQLFVNFGIIKNSTQKEWLILKKELDERNQALAKLSVSNDVDQITIRKYTNNDVQDIKKIIADDIQDFLWVCPTGYDPKNKEHFLLCNINTDNAFVLTHNNKVAAFITYKVNNSSFGEIVMLSTKNEFRGKGYATKLLIYVINELKKKNIKNIEIEVAVQNPALKLYEKVGFIITKEQRDKKPSIVNEAPEKIKKDSNEKIIDSGFIRFLNWPAYERFIKAYGSK